MLGTVAPGPGPGPAGVRHRESASSLASSASQSTSHSARRRPPLAITPPHHSPFLPPPAHPRPGSSLSREHDWSTDDDAAAADDESGASEAGQGEPFLTGVTPRGYDHMDGVDELDGQSSADGLGEGEGEDDGECLVSTINFGSSHSPSSSWDQSLGQVQIQPPTPNPTQQPQQNSTEHSTSTPSIQNSSPAPAPAPTPDSPAYSTHDPALEPLAEPTSADQALIHQSAAGLGLGLGLTNETIEGHSRLINHKPLDQLQSPSQPASPTSLTRLSGRQFSLGSNNDNSAASAQGGTSSAPVHSACTALGSALDDLGTTAPASSTVRSPRTSESSAVQSTASSINIPTEPAADLSLSNRSANGSGVFMSVANSPLARLAAGSGAVPIGNRQRSHSGGPRAFLSALLSRSPRSPSGSPSSSPQSSPRLGQARSPANNQGPFGSPLASFRQREPNRIAGTDVITDNPFEAAQAALFGTVPAPAQTDRSDTESSHSGQARRTPRSIAAATFAGLTRASSMRGAGSPSMASSPSMPSVNNPPPSFMHATRSGAVPRSASAPISPAVTVGFATPGPDRAPTAAPPTLNDIGLSLAPITPSMGLGRNAQPLCGAILDNKYLLIGTNTGLDFLPLPLPGSLPMRTHGRKRKETRKPIPLIKRTRFKELSVLSERSNILLAIAGRNDHVRVYALDGIRAMIERKMNDLDARDGYPYLPNGVDGAGPLASSSAPAKGKAKAEPFVPSATRPQSIFPRPQSSRGASSSSAQPEPFHFPASSPPPDYSIAAPSPSLRRRVPSAYGPGSLLSPVSPARTTTGSIVRAVPTNLGSSGMVGPASPRTLRAQKSREFVASRRGSGAVLPRRKSRIDVNEPSSSSRRGSVASSVDRPEAQPAPPLPSLDRVSASAASFSLSSPLAPTATDDRLLSACGGGQRRQSTASSIGDESSWHTSVGGSPNPDRLQPRREESIMARRASATAELALFLRQSGPNELAPPPRITRAKSVGDEIRSLLPSRSQSSIGRSATSPALQNVPAPSPTASLTEFLRLSTGSANSELDRRHSAALTNFSSSGSSLPKLKSREPTSPKLISTERSPTADLIDMLRETGPDDVNPRQGLSRRPTPREASSPALKLHEMSPEMELAGFMRETGPDSVGAGSGMSRTPSSLAPAWNGSYNGSDSRLPLLGAAPSDEGGDSRRSSVGEGGFDPAAARAAMAAQATAGSSLSVNSPVRPGFARTLSAQRRLIARSPITESLPVEGSESESSPEIGAAPFPPDRRKSLTLSQMMRDGPPPGAGLGGPIVPPASNLLPHAPSAPGSPQSRSKRWTMSVGSMLGASRQSSGSPTGGGSAGLVPSPRRVSSDGRASMERTQLELNHPLPVAQPSPEVPRQVQAVSAPSPPPAAPTWAPGSGDLKRPAVPLHRASHAPSVPASSQAPPDTHPANPTSPLEYVKLARTRGARLLRAVETKKRTYLAVLCGDEGERIELFTGSRSISLSLNRTFVLPESPRTIEFQLQGDDLIDVYLVYPESIFALEPATVRVREVGVGRGERRQRRERERRMRDLAASAAAPEAGALSGGDGSGSGSGNELVGGGEVLASLEASLPAAAPTLHPADPARTEGLPRPITPETRSAEGMDSPLTGAEVESRSSSPVRRIRAPTAGSDAAQSSPARPSPSPAAGRSTSSAASTPAPASGSAAGASPNSNPTSTKPKHALPYTTFQQLPFVPPVPSSVLSSAWTIPPLYTDVVGSGSAASPPPPPHAFNTVPHITQSGELGAGLPAAEEEAPGFAMNENLPLLSPISLLGGTAQRQAGPPGLFFVSKGKNLSGIVTGDGRSVIKRPLVWSLDKAPESDADVYDRIEMVIVHAAGAAAPRTVVVGLGNREVRAIAVGGEAGEAPFGQAVGVAGAGVGVSAREREKDAAKEREVKWLGTQGGGSQLFFSERVGQSWTVSVLAARN